MICKFCGKEIVEYMEGFYESHDGNDFCYRFVDGSSNNDLMHEPSDA